MADAVSQVPGDPAVLAYDHQAEGKGSVGGRDPVVQVEDGRHGDLRPVHRLSGQREPLRGGPGGTGDVFGQELKPLKEVAGLPDVDEEEGRTVLVVLVDSFQARHPVLEEVTGTTAEDEHDRLLPAEAGEPHLP